MIFLVWLLPILLGTWGGANKGRALAGFALPFLLSWLGFLFVGALRPGANHVPKGKRRCPFCAETIREEAVVCGHCQRDLSPALRTG